mmetsp:Transcript_16710/g.25861  ORF Transcript_16710/g.25861 Transcript_16710/m.25861 type:complete len:212 (-) Transcript_16710:87-722(-)
MHCVQFLFLVRTQLIHILHQSLNASCVRLFFALENAQKFGIALLSRGQRCISHHKHLKWFWHESTSNSACFFAFLQWRSIRRRCDFSIEPFNERFLLGLRIVQVSQSQLALQLLLRQLVDVLFVLWHQTHVVLLLEILDHFNFFAAQVLLQLTACDQQLSHILRQQSRVFGILQCGRIPIHNFLVVWRVAFLVFSVGDLFIFFRIFFCRHL